MAEPVGCTECEAQRGPCRDCAEVRRLVARASAGERTAMREALSRVLVAVGAALAQGALADAHEARARAIALERAALRAHIRGDGKADLRLLTGPRRGVWCAWEGRGVVGAALGATRGGARWRRLTEQAAALPEMAAELAALAE